MSEMGRKMMETQGIIEECREKIKDADIVLIGFGPEFNIADDKLLEEMDIYKHMDLDSWPLDDIEKRWIKLALMHKLSTKSKSQLKAETVKLYDDILTYLESNNLKNYFVVTTCKDDVIYDSNFDSSRIVAPLGTKSLMKCDKGCFKTVYPTIDVYDNIYSILEKYDFHCNDTRICTELKEAMPQCPMCKQVMSENRYKTNNYSAEGYREAWDTYTAWLQKTLNRKLVMLELGEGFDTPTVIRWPFEKVAAVNNKSTLVRVNKNFWQIAEDIEGKAIPVKMTGVDFVRRLING